MTIRGRLHGQLRRLAPAAALAAALVPVAALAAPGDLIRTVALPVPGVGVSVAVDCDGRVYYTNTGDATLHVIDKDGNLVGSFPTLDATSSAPVLLDELAWDAQRELLWACEHDTNPIRVWRVDPSNGQCTHAFDSSFVSFGSYRDGIAWDATDDTLWLSGDVSSEVEHYSALGTRLGSITPIDALGATLGYISGVQVGLGDLLYLGQNGRAQIVRVRKSDGGFIASFASPGGTRDEGLECDTANFAPRLAMWSRDFAYPGALAVVEVEAQTCSCVDCSSNRVDAKGQAPSPVCAGARITLDGAASVFSCPAGIDFRWLENGSEVCPWSPAPTCDVTVVAISVYELQVRCRDTPECVDTVTLRVEVGPGPSAVLAALPTICPGEEVTLDASASTPGACAGGLEYRFLSGPTVLRGWTSSATYGPIVPAATTTYSAAVRCVAAPACVSAASATVIVDAGVRPRDLGNTLMQVRRGGLVEESWSSVPEARSYTLYRHTGKSAWPPPPLRSGLAQASNQEPDVPGPPPLYFYRVAGVSCGGLEGP